MPPSSRDVDDDGRLRYDDLEQPMREPRDAVNAWISVLSRGDGSDPGQDGGWVGNSERVEEAQEAVDGAWRSGAGSSGAKRFRAWGRWSRSPSSVRPLSASAVMSRIR